MMICTSSNSGCFPASIRSEDEDKGKEIVERRKEWRKGEMAKG
jgi:hypothetical protein